ncbi:NAD(P)-dependent oxidoreductase [Nitriliruptor alkaliphilus]|uniref:NAD(P)-dependent oxidoreductase n=1 Tax=Nitriliruptor alkaliphilus TaxID=427918 RepID=UPI000B33DD19|nr:NAD(P)-binding domain-containing protein [Nitriliruptor alkaliphilus]
MNPPTTDLLAAPDAANDARGRPVTVIGLGAMGHTLARTFLAAGHPTTVWNRTASRADDLVADGATLADSVSAAVTAGPLIVVCVLDNDTTLSLLDPLGDELAGRAVVNLTSTTPEDARAFHTWATSRGVDHLDGAIMVPTPVVGTDDTLVLYSGAREVFDTHHATLASLGGTADYLGTDPGRAGLFDLGMLDVFFAGMTAFLHATAMVGADGIAPTTFLPYARTIVSVLDEVLPGLAAEVEAGSYPGDADNIAMELAAMEHVVRVSEARGIDTTLPEVTRRLLATAVEQGHGRDTFSRIVEQLRQPSA